MNNDEIIEVLNNCAIRGSNRRYTLDQIIKSAMKALKHSGTNFNYDDIHILIEPIYAQIQSEANS